MGTSTPAAHELDAEDEAVVVEAEAPPARRRPAPASRASPTAWRWPRPRRCRRSGNLGYGPGEAVQAVARAVESHPGAETPEIIRAALRLLAPKD